MQITLKYHPHYNEGDNVVQRDEDREFRLSVEIDQNTPLQNILGAVHASVLLVEGETIQQNDLHDGGEYNVVSAAVRKTINKFKRQKGPLKLRSTAS